MVLGVCSLFLAVIFPQFFPISCAQALQIGDYTAQMPFDGSFDKAVGTGTAVTSGTFTFDTPGNYYKKHPASFPGEPFNLQHVQLVG